MMLMDHKSHEVLKKEMVEAANQIKTGGLYTHYKNPDRLYKVIGFAVLEASDEVCVLYEAQYGDHLVFIRPVSNWIQLVDYGGDQVLRFKKV